MRHNVQILIYLIISFPLIVQGQGSSLISNLEYVLFQRDIDSTRYKYSFWSFQEQDSIQITSRYKNIPENRKDGLVNKICDTIRWKNAAYLVPELTTLLKRQEEIFINEWGPVFESTGAPEGLWEDQFNVLCIMDLTISYLKILKEKWSASQKYDFVKNLYLLSYGDYNTQRLKSTLYTSKYIREKRNGYCRCNLVQKANFERTLVDEFFLQDSEMINELLKDVTGLRKIEIPEDVQKFYSRGLRNVFYKIPDKRIDSLLINNSDQLINLGFQDKVDYWDNELPIKFYHLLLGRYQFASKNPRFIDILLDDVFNNSVSEENLRKTLAILTRQNDHLIDYMILDRIMMGFVSENSNDKIATLISLCNTLLSNDDRKYLQYKLEKMVQENKLSLDKANNIKNGLSN